MDGAPAAGEMAWPRLWGALLDGQVGELSRGSVIPWQGAE